MVVILSQSDASRFLVLGFIKVPPDFLPQAISTPARQSSHLFYFLKIEIKTAITETIIAAILSNIVHLWRVSFIR